MVDGSGAEHGLPHGVNEPTWQERLGGRWAVSWQAYGIGVALNAPLLVLTGGSIGAEPVEAAQMPAWAVVAVVASAVTALWVLIGDRLLFPHRRERPVPVAAVVGYHTVTGLIFTMTIWFVGPLLGVRTGESLLELAVPTVAIGLWFGLTMVLLLDARDRFTRRREQLLAESVRAELVILQEDETADRVESLIRDRVGTATIDLRSAISTSLDSLGPSSAEERSGAEWRELAARVRDSAESSLRPLSHELWRAAEQEFPRPGWTDVLRQWITTGAPAVLPSGLIVFIGYVRGGVYALDVLPGVLAAVGLALLVMGVLAATASAMSRWPGLRALLALAAFLTAQGMGLAFALLLAAQPTPAEAFGSIAAMSISVLAPSIVAALDDARGVVLDRLRGSADAVRAQQIAQARMLADVTQRAARIIHGSLQTKLIAAAAAIESAVDSEDPDLLERSLSHVSQILEGLTSEDRSGGVLSVEVTRACDAWMGILQTVLDIAPEAASITGDPAISAGLIVEEALSNAHRHGDATSAIITITHSRDDDGVARICLSIKDDGSSDSIGPAGLGTVLLKGLAGGDVHLDPQPDGFLLTASIRCAEAAGDAD